MITRSGGFRRVRRLFAVAMVCAMATLCVPAQESTGYVMDRVTITSTADVALSASFQVAVTFGQQGPVGSVSICNAGAFQSTGFWSIIGDPPVPIFLDVLKDMVDPSSVDLSWTGAAPLFEIFRGEMADSVPAPANSVLTTSLCVGSDSPPAGAIFYYLVLPAGH